jgi:hypothetical protein
MREQLCSLMEALRQTGDGALAERVGAALAGSDADVDAFLVSNELWGGAGSIADQAGTGADRTSSRRTVEAALIELGDVQIQSGKVNRRTAMWVETFKEWRRDGI